MNTNNNFKINDFGNLFESYMNMYKNVIDIGLKSKPNFNLFNSSENCDSCPPKETCPPKYLGRIHRQAMKSEIIIIPFTVKNTCSITKTYRIGIRELKDLDGNLAPEQPVLKKRKVILAPNQSERIFMEINLAEFNDTNYQAEIVIRENEYNQNILFTLSVQDYDAAVFSPIDEAKYKRKWQSWKSHFYCDSPKRN